MVEVVMVRVAPVKERTTAMVVTSHARVDLLSG